VLLVWALSVAAFFVFARYRHPLVPILALFAGAALVEGLAALRARRFGALAAAAALAGLVALIVHRPLDARDPRAVTYASLGGALDDAGRSAEAAAYLERAVALSPAFAEAHRALAHLRFGRGELDAAEAGYRRAVELDPGDAEAWNNLGVLAARRSDLPAALERFRRALAADGRHRSALFNLGRTLLEAGDRRGALVTFSRLAEIAPADAEARAYLAALRQESAPPSAP
jgi:Tfp pilus assembly protein PilF